MLHSSLQLLSRLLSFSLSWPLITMLALSSLSTQAQTTATAAASYPSRNVTIVVPLAAGTGMDTLVRLYAERLTQSLDRLPPESNRHAVRCTF